MTFSGSLPTARAERTSRLGQAPRFCCSAAGGGMGHLLNKVYGIVKFRVAEPLCKNER
jgi:hypothetical protein